MLRRICILTLAGILSFALVLASMQIVCYFISRIFGVPPSHNVIWLVK